jgi:hypothetical protein
VGNGHLWCGGYWQEAAQKVRVCGRAECFSGVSVQGWENIWNFIQQD